MYGVFHHIYGHLPRQIRFWKTLIKNCDWVRHPAPLFVTKSQVFPKIQVEGSPYSYVPGISMYLATCSKTEFPCQFCGKGFSGAAIRDIGYHARQTLTWPRIWPARHFHERQQRWCHPMYCLPGRVYHIFRDLLKRFSSDHARCKTDTIPVWGCTGCTFEMHTGVQWLDGRRELPTKYCSYFPQPLCTE